MNVIVVDDERIILLTETKKVQAVLPNANISSFKSPKEAIEYASENRVDIAFLDINMGTMTGIELAKKLEEFNPRINILFCTGYSEYSLDAIELYCSAYLMKPVTEERIKEALTKLRYPLEEIKNHVKVHCFGNFEVFKDGEPIKFKNTKTKELFAYLIDRQGATVSTKEIMVALFEDDNKDSYIRNLRSDLFSTLESLGVADVINKNGNNIGVNMSKVDCDFYDYLNGDRNLFQGEYMSQYEFGEETLAWLSNDY